nr:polyprotein [Mute swan feces associated hepatovirus 2]
MLKNLAEGVGKIVGLLDPVQENNLMVPDRVAVGGAATSTIVDQATVTSAAFGTHQPDPFPAAVDLQGSLEATGEKFYLLWQGSWSSTNRRLHVFTDINPFELLCESRYASSAEIAYYKYMKADLEIMVQVNATQWMQGCLAVSAVPGTRDQMSFASVGSGPHGYINLAMNNCVRLTVPFVYTRNYYMARGSLYQPWVITIVVYNPLKYSAQTTPSATVSVLGRFSNLVLHGLRPTSMMMKVQPVRVASSINAINLSNVPEQGDFMSLAVNDEHSLPNPVNSGGLKITDFTPWTSSPTLMGYFEVRANHEPGAKVACWPVSPTYSCMKDETGDFHITSLASVSQMFAFWKGDLIYYLQAVGTKFHNCRLLVAFIPGQTVNGISQLGMRTATTGMYTVFDVTGVMSTCVFRVPWCSSTNYCLNNSSTRDTGLASYPTSTGVVIVYLLSKLNVPTGVTQTMEFNVFVSAENFDLFCPMYDKTERGNSSNDGLLPFHTTAYPNMATEGDVKGESFDTADVVQQDQVGPVMVNAPMMNIPTGAATAIEDPTLEKSPPQTFPQQAPGIPRHSKNHATFRNFMGKPHYYFTWTFRVGSSGKQALTFPLDIRRYDQATTGVGGVLQWFFKLFQLYRGPLNITCVFSSSARVDGILYFTPMGMNATASWQHSTPDSMNADYIGGYTGIRFNTRQTSNVRVTVPFYTALPYISANVPNTQKDSCFGFLTMIISNYTGSDEPFGFSCYLSLTDESECYVPRPVLRNNMMYPSSAAIGYLGEQLIEVLEGEVPEDRQGCVLPHVPSPVVEGGFKRQMYKSLRMKVGEARLKYAFEELKGQETHLVTQSGFMFPNYTLVQQRKDKFLYRGFVYEGKVYTTSFISQMSSKLPVVKNATLVAIPESPDWLNMNTTVEERLANKYVIIFKEGLRFNWSQFTSGEFERCFDEQSFIYLNYHLGADLEAILNIFLGKSLGVIDRCVMDSVVMNQLLETNDIVRDTISETRTLVGDIQKAIDVLGTHLKLKKLKLVTRIVTLMVKLSLKMYNAVHTNWDTGIVVSGVADVLMDCLDCGIDMADFVTNTLNEMFSKEAHTQSITLRDAAAAFSVFKSTKSCFEWVVGHFREWYNQRYGPECKKMQALLQHEVEIQQLMSLVDDYLTTEVKTKEKYTEGVEIIRILRTVQSLIAANPELVKFANDIRESIRGVHLKLRNANLDYEDAVQRPEPYVIYLYGDRGCGKTIAAMSIAAKLCKQHGVDPKKNIYTKPVGSEFWDGYTGQMVCIMDDIGQDTSDEDWTGFCQLVSSCPLRLNMASLELKGMHFHTPFIICTSNVYKPDPRTIHFREAVIRRIHAWIKVTAKDFYLTRINGIPVLDVERAKRDNTIVDMSCVDMRDESGASVTVDDLVTMAMMTYTSRQKNMDEFLKLWTQSGDTKLFGRVALPITRKAVLNAMFDTIRSNKYYVIGTVVSLLAVVGLGVGVWRALKKCETRGVYSANTVVKKVINLDDKIQTQSMLDLSLVIEKNLCRFGISTEPGQVRWVLNALGLYGTWLLVPSHAYKYDPGVTHFYLNRQGVVYAVSRSRCIIVEHPSNPDISFISFPSITHFRDIRDHFVDAEDVKKCDGVPATLCTNNAGLYTIIPEGIVKFRDEQCYTHTTIDGKEFKIFVSGVWKGNGESADGSCGGVLVTHNSKVTGKFIGIHTAASGKVMVSACVTRQDLNVTENAIRTSGRIVYCTQAARPTHTSSRSKYVRSPLYDHYNVEVHKMPAALLYKNPSDLDVAAQMLSKFDHPLVSRPLEYSVSMYAVLDKIHDGLGPYEIKVLSVEEAILGFGNMDGLNMQTGPGLPYVLDNKKKKDMISEGKIVDKELYWRVCANQNNAIFGYPMDIQFQTCCKDELRLVDKVLSGKTRTIDVCPVDATIVYRQFLGALASAIHSRPGLGTGIAVGIDPDSDWTPLFQDCVRFGDYGIGLDYKEFDASMSPFMIYDAVFVLATLSRLPPPIIRCLGMTLECTTRCFGPLQYQVNGSLPSGCPLTSLINSVANLTIIHFALSKGLGVRPDEVFSLFKVLVYGDDCMIIIKRGFDVTNQGLQKVKQVIADLGLVVTGADKGPIKVTPVTELEFLKRKQRWCSDGHVHPCLDVRSIHSLVQWKSKDGTLRENLENALWFGYQHGRGFYAELCQDISDACRSADISFRIPTYEEQSARFRGLFLGRDTS